MDRIVGLRGRSESADELGGLAYTLAGAAAVLPPEWHLLPLARVGEDALDVVEDWLIAAGFDTGGIVEVPAPNNRVELRYHDDARRTERLTGGVGGWDGGDLAASAAECDALLVNFISGHELTVDAASMVRSAFGGPVYADLHSLFLGNGQDGVREPRRLPSWPRWMTCFDTVQLNADEMDLLRGETPVEAMARRVLAAGPSLLACTQGVDGAVCWSRRDDGSVVKHEIPSYPVDEPDPTGCGDVWAGVMCCRLLAGDGEPDAARKASRVSAAAAERSGVSGLIRHLREVTAAVGEAQTREEDS